MLTGVSVVLCCHNGASRLPVTLAHLKAQIPPAAPWELLLVDNASDDDTAQIAVSIWADGPAPLRIITEPVLGLQRARARALREANYEFVGFVDDDNWLERNWLSIAYQTLADNSSLGAIGSVCIPAFESTEPKWFRDYHSIYAILDEAEYPETTSEYLHGAGLCIRRRAWARLLEGGFHSILTDRVGQRLSGGGDAELTMAIRLAGWKIRVEPSMRLRHFMPSYRLQWRYLRLLHREYEKSQVELDAYCAHNFMRNPNLRWRLGQLWWCQIARSLLWLARQPNSVLAALISSGESRRDVIEVERTFGRLLGLLRLRNHYGRFRKGIRSAPWIQTAASNDKLRVGTTNPGVIN
jgi:glycosyltransferase involved in cell wall biosynthesis